MDLERISTNITEHWEQTTDNMEAKKMETNKISPISDVKFSDEMSRDVEVKPKKQSKLGKIKAQLSTQSLQLRQKLKVALHPYMMTRSQWQRKRKVI